MRTLDRLRRLRRNPRAGVAVVFACFSAAFAVRYVFNGLVPGVPFVTFFPVVLVATLVLGHVAGIVVSACAAAVAAIVFTPHGWRAGTLWPDGPISLALYLITCGILIWIAEQLVRGMDAVQRERDRSAALFSELQHRVANTMQFVSAGLLLESKRLGRDTPAGRSLAGFSARLAQWGKLHRLLYDPDLGSAPAGEVIEQLCREIIEAAGYTGVAFHIRAPAGLTIPAEQALPLYLLIGELVTNAVKHAFPVGQGGEISVSVIAGSDGLVVTVRDNGCGIDKVATGASKGLGSQIVRSLAVQLGGTVEVRSGVDGTTVVIALPKKT